MAQPQISNALTEMINNAIDEGIFPDSLKRAQVTPVLKKADNLSKKNYRPVSILPCLSEIFERVIANRLNEYFEGIFFVGPASATSDQYCIGIGSTHRGCWVNLKPCGITILMVTEDHPSLSSSAVA